ncbi:ecotin family protein [Kiritimatiellaeota bacterium B1221]|nr:ecotin family protein [Kiritimatiellaeota bacterium B1221]
MKTLILLPLLFALSLHAAEHKELKAYPPADEGQIRHVIVVPYMVNEQDLKVEVFVGKTMMTDGVNRLRMGGKFERKTIEGWGYSYYTAETGPVASTMMAPRPGQEQVERFVHMNGEMLRYNSKLPIVIYTLEDTEVRYRIWTAGKTVKVEE